MRLCWILLAHDRQIAFGRECYVPQVVLEALEEEKDTYLALGGKLWHLPWL